MVCTLIYRRNDVKFVKLSLPPGLFTVDCEGLHARVSVERRRHKKRGRLLVVWSTVTSTQISNHETTKKRCNENKQHNKQAKTEEVERTFNMFANSVFLNPGKDVYGHGGMFSLTDILRIAVAIFRIVFLLFLLCF